MIKILFISDGLRRGGKERQIVENIKGLTCFEFIKIGVITFNRNQDYSEEVKSRTTFYVELNKHPTRLEPFFSIWRCFQQFKPDIVHTWDSLSSLYSFLPSKVFGVKFIDGSIRDAGIERGWQLYLKKFFIRRAHLVLSNSYTGLKHYKTTGDVLFNSIDQRRFVDPSSTEEFNLIMVASFTDYKDHKTFIDASGELLSRDHVDRVYMAGDGPRKKEFMDYVKISFDHLLERFIFLGAINNVEEYLSKCKVGVLCSTTKYGEGISNSVLEYMAGGLVAITTDIGGMNEVVEDGQNGYLIKEKDSRSIVNIVVQLRETPELMNWLTYNARKTIESKFSYENNIKHLKKIYIGLCSEK